MGMFDSVYLPVKCPNCGDEGEKEFQTKDLRCYMDTYRVGDSIGTTQFRWLGGYIGCRSDACHKWQKERDGYRSGFGYGWDGWLEIGDDGCITGRFETEIPKATPSALEGK